jgi:hypothetical protein
MNTDFRTEKSDSGYRVEMYRNGKPYVTFLDGLSKGGAEREAQRLAILWDKFHTRSKPKLQQRRG